MSTTVGAVIDRLYRDWLEPLDQAPIQVTLSAAQSSTTDESFSYADALVSADEEELIAVGKRAEIGREQIQIKTVDRTANTFTARRGVNGTTATTHASGAVVTFNREFSRQTVFDAVCDQVVSLYPGLFRVVTTTITTDDEPVEVPAATIAVRDFAYVDGTDTVPATHSVRLLPYWTAVASGKAVLLTGVPTGKTAYFTYEARFTRPTAEADDLVSTTGLEQGWIEIVVLGVLAQLASTYDFSSATREFITSQLEQERFPLASGARLRDSLLRYRAFLLDEAKRTHRTIHRPGVVMRPIGRRRG